MNQIGPTLFSGKFPPDRLSNVFKPIWQSFDHFGRVQEKQSLNIFTFPAHSQLNVLKGNLRTVKVSIRQEKSNNLSPSTGLFIIFYTF